MDKLYYFSSSNTLFASGLMIVIWCMSQKLKNQKIKKIKNCFQIVSCWGLRRILFLFYPLSLVELVMQHDYLINAY